MTRPSTDVAHLRIDDPVPGAAVDPLCLRVRGWVFLGFQQPSIASVEALCGSTIVGATCMLSERPDVTAELGLPSGTKTGFEIFAHCPDFAPGAQLPIAVRVRFRDSALSPAVLGVTVEAIGRDYRTNHFGALLDRRTTAVHHHENVFGSGPSQRIANPELERLIGSYLPPAPGRIVDVGCGLGCYEPSLARAGYRWTGVEIDPDDCRELARLGVNFVQADGRSLPFSDASFDAALCVEVLEHVGDLSNFLREVKRVSPGQLLVSVPNCELLGYLWDYLATPWHMLESTHVNFFTRWSLAALLRQFYSRVEIQFYSPYPLKTVEGTSLYYHLFAIATDEPRLDQS